LIENGIVLPPYEVLIHPSSRCNLQCEWCIGGQVPTEPGQTKQILDNLPNLLHDPDSMDKLIEGIVSYRKTVQTKTGPKEFGVENVSFSGIVGEPLVPAKSVIAAMNKLVEHKKRVGIFTNASLVRENMLETLMQIKYMAISVDAATPQTYSNLKFSGRSMGDKIFQDVLKNIDLLVKTRANTPEGLVRLKSSPCDYGVK